MHIKQFIIRNTALQSAVLVLLAATLLFYLPVLLNPDLVLSRNNDLQEQFWPVFYYIRQHTLQDLIPPLWNNLFFSGIPLLPDPQFSLFYPPNWLFILLPTSIAFLVLFLLHSFTAGLGLYLLANKGFKLPFSASLLSALLYLISPRLAGYLEAGHYGLIATLTWLPFLVLATVYLVKKPRLNWSLLLAISQAALFFTHTVTFFWAVVANCFFFAFILVSTKGLNPKSWVKPIGFYLLSAVIAFGLSAATLLPQLEWAPQTTRFLLLEDRDVYPKWSSVMEFVQVIVVPWLYKGGAWSINTEKWLVLGITPLILALIGWWRLKNLHKATLVISAFLLSLIALNNASPIYHFLLSQKWYLLARVSTRIWIIPLLATVLLAGKGLSELQGSLKRKTLAVKILKLLLIAVPVMELLLISWLLLIKPVDDNLKSPPKKLYQYLSSDKEIFRTFCFNRCLSQQQAAKANLQLIEGYNTLQQTNYYKHFWQLSGGYWNYYTLALPPMGSPPLHPDYKSLGLYNTKYIISPVQLQDDALTGKKKFGNYYLYQNKLFKPRAYFWSQNTSGPIAPILEYAPNSIRVDTSSFQGSSIVLAEVYNPGWKAFSNGQTEIPIQETPNSLRLVDLEPQSKYIDFIYDPLSYKTGRIITALTVVLILLTLFYQSFYRWNLKPKKVRYNKYDSKA